MTEAPTRTAGAALLDLYPQLGMLAGVPSFVAAVADDLWIEEMTPWLRIADLVKDEDAHWSRLVAAIPEVTKFDLPPVEGQSLADKYRRNARRAAIRTIAVASPNLGNQAFESHPLFGGEASIRVLVAGLPNCRIGRATDTAWRASPSAVARLLKNLAADGAIGAVERAIFPMVGAVEDYEKCFATWAELEALREWEETHRLPLIGIKALDVATPAGYDRRYAPEDIASTRVPMSVAAKISSPYAASLVGEVHGALGSTSRSADELIAWAVSRCTG